jgi:hypothetical protein
MVQDMEFSNTSLPSADASQQQAWIKLTQFDYEISGTVMIKSVRSTDGNVPVSFEQDKNTIDCESRDCS